MAGPCYFKSPRDYTCLNGGVCPNFTRFGNDTNYESNVVCICPPGHSADNLLFHNGNCALPDNTVEGFFIYFTLISALVMYFLYREWRWTVNLGWRLGIITLGLVLIGWAIVFAAWLQNGYYESVAFLVFVAECTTASLAYHLFLAFVIPLCTIARVPHKRIRYWLKRWTTGMMFPFFAFFVALEVESRRDLEKFNWIQCAHSILILFGNIVFCTALIIQSRSLAKVLSDLSTSSNMPSRRKKEIDMLEFRTRMITIALVVYLVGVVLSIGALIAMLCILGSALYGWVFACVAGHFSLVLGAGMTVFLHQRNEIDRSSIGHTVKWNKDHKSDVRGDDYMSWTKTRTNQTNQTRTTDGIKVRSVHKGVLSVPRTNNGDDDSLPPVTEHSMDEEEIEQYARHKRALALPASGFQVVDSNFEASSLGPAGQISQISQVDPEPLNDTKEKHVSFQEINREYFSNAGSLTRPRGVPVLSSLFASGQQKEEAAPASSVQSSAQSDNRSSSKSHKGVLGAYSRFRSSNTSKYSYATRYDESQVELTPDF